MKKAMKDIQASVETYITKPDAIRLAAALNIIRRADRRTSVIKNLSKLAAVIGKSVYEYYRLFEEIKALPGHDFIRELIRGGYYDRDLLKTKLDDVEQVMIYPPLTNSAMILKKTQARLASHIEGEDLRLAFEALTSYLGFTPIPFGEEPNYVSQVLAVSDNEASIHKLNQYNTIVKYMLSLKDIAFPPEELLNKITVNNVYLTTKNADLLSTALKHITIYAIDLQNQNSKDEQSSE